MKDTMYINVPNFLSILRIMSIPLLIILLSYGEQVAALTVFVCAAISDGLDGFIARRFKQKTMVGAYLDPIADKLLLTSSFVAFALLGLIPKWLSILVVSRDVIIAMGILILQLVSVRVEIRPSVVSKCTTVFQLTTIGGRLLFDILHRNQDALTYLYWATGFFTVASGLQYVVRGLRIVNENKIEG
jgi:cardiolipin synthase (CMP-forming)